MCKTGLSNPRDSGGREWSFYIPTHVRLYYLFFYLQHHSLFPNPESLLKEHTSKDRKHALFRLKKETKVLLHQHRSNIAVSIQ